MVARYELPLLRGQPLSMGEFMAAYLYAYGLSGKQVAYRLKITESGARERIKRVYAKLEINDRMALLRYMEEEGT